MTKNHIWIAVILSASVLGVVWMVTSANIENRKTDLEKAKVQQIEESTRIKTKQSEATNRTKERWGFLPWMRKDK